MSDFVYYDTGSGIPHEIKVPLPGVEELIAQNAQQIASHLPLSLPDKVGPLSKAQDINKEELKGIKGDRSRSAYFDPYFASSFLNNVRRPSSVSFEMLRRMALKCRPVTAVIQTRLNQVANYTHPKRTKNEMAYEINLKDRKRKPTASDKNRMAEIEYFLEHTGYSDPGGSPNGDRRVDFETFIRCLVRDRLSLDATTFERTFDGMGRLAEVLAVDGATIRKVINKDQYHSELSIGLAQMQGSQNLIQPAKPIKIENVKYIQVVKGQTVAEFSGRELVYGIANPRTDIDSLGYGMSELEMMIETVTAHLYAEQYNRSFFTQGSMPPGVISIIGNYDQEMMEAFKRQWTMQVAGVTNAWKLPVIAMTDGEGFKFTPFNMSSRDMEFHLWITYLVAVVCSIYQIDPEEIGFQGYRPQSSGSLFQHTGEYKLQESKDRGLKPLMRFMQKLINKEIIDLIYDDLELRWTNFDEKTEQEKLEVWGKELELGLKTVNEVRAERDEDEIKEDWANAPVNATLNRIWVEDRQREQGPEQQVGQAETEEYLQQRFPWRQELTQPGGNGNGKPGKSVKKSQTEDKVVLEIEI